MLRDNEIGYYLYGEILRFKAEEFNHNGKRLSFPETLSLMKKKNIPLRNEKTRKIDYTEWNINDVDELISLIYNKVKIYDSSEDRKGLINKNKNAVKLSPKREAIIMLESCYAKHELIYLDSFIVVYVIKGKCKVGFQNHIYKLETNGGCIIPPNVPYYISCTIDDAVLSIISSREHFKSNFSQLLTSENILSEFFRETFLKENMEPHLFVLPFDQNVRGIIKSMLVEFENNDEFAKINFHNYLQAFYISIVRSCDATYDYYKNSKTTSVRIVMPSILKYMNDNYKQVTLISLARQFNYDSAYLSRLFKRLLGRSFHEILTELKLNEAKRLLVESNYSIEYIAKQVGYNSYDAFGIAFKKAIGMTPMQYRKSNIYEE